MKKYWFFTHRNRVSRSSASPRRRGRPGRPARENTVFLKHAFRRQGRRPSQADRPICFGAPRRRPSAGARSLVTPLPSTRSLVPTRRHDTSPRHVATTRRHNASPQHVATNVATTRHHNTSPHHITTRRRHSTLPQHVATTRRHSTSPQHVATSNRHAPPLHHGPWPGGMREAIK